MKQLINLCATAVLLAGLAGRTATSADAESVQLKVGDIAPPLETTSIEGIPVSFRPAAGQVLLIQAYSPKDKKSDDLAKPLVVLYRRFHDKGLQIIGICSRVSEDPFFRFAEKWQFPWPNVIEAKAIKDVPDDSPARHFGFTDSPANLLIDSQGKVLAVDISSDDAHAAVAKALNVSLTDLPMPPVPEPRPERRRGRGYTAFVPAEAREPLGTVEERADAEPCKQNLRQISLALSAYRDDHKDELPRHLSDLFREYLQDEKVLLCPKDPTPLDGFKEFADPRMKCSYLYEFSPEPRSRKIGQLGEWGDKVAMVRCTRHGRWMSLSYGGEIYFSQTPWENDFPQGKTLDSGGAKVRKQFRTIAVAVARYRKDKGDVPGEIEDLYPDYLKDKAILTCPVTGQPFSYQFSVSREHGDGTYRGWKLEQVKQFGGYVPLLRAKDVLEDGRVINLSYDGEIYESPDTWENLFGG